MRSLKPAGRAMEPAKRAYSWEVLKASWEGLGASLEARGMAETEKNSCKSITWSAVPSASVASLKLVIWLRPRRGQRPKMCTAGQRVSLTITGPGPSFLRY